MFSLYLLHLYLFLFIEDLMSLLDADIHSAHPSVIIDADAMFSEDISYFGYPSFRRSSLSRLGSSRGNFVFISCDYWPYGEIVVKFTVFEL